MYASRGCISGRTSVGYSRDMRREHAAEASAATTRLKGWFAWTCAVALLGADTSAAAIGHFRLAWAVLAVLGTVCAVAIAVAGRPEPV